MQELDFSQGVVRFKEGRTVVNLNRLIISGILIEQLHILLLVREVCSMVPIGGFLSTPAIQSLNNSTYCEVPPTLTFGATPVRVLRL